MLSFRAAAAAIFFLLAPSLKTAAYLQLPGITGASTDDKHKNWILLESASFGANAAGGGGTASGSHEGKVPAHGVTIVHVTDKSSPDLMQAVANGKHFPTAEIDLGTVRYLMTDVTLTSVQHMGSAGGGGGPTERISMVFKTIQIQYTPQQPDTKGTALAATAPRPLAAPVPPAPATAAPPVRAATAGAASAPAAVAAPVGSVSPASSSAATLQAQLTPSLGPSTRSWVASEGRFLSQNNASGAQLAAAAHQAAKGRFPGAPDNVIEALTFLALMDGARANHNEAQFQAAINQVLPLTSAAAAAGIASLR